jgi:hypothetical protein
MAADIEITGMLGRRSSGRRNRDRANGQSTYNKKGKGRVADNYGTWRGGERLTADRISTDRRAVDTVEVDETPTPAVLAGKAAA